MTTNADANADFQSANQPTDATIGVCSMEQEYLDDTTQKLIAANHRLTAQLAAKQAQAKAWEAWGEQQHHALYALNEGVECYCVDTSKICRGCEDTINALSTPKPQPVDASSLARIARVALVAYKFMHAEKSTNCGIDFWSEFVDAYNAIQPNDIALAQALAGGA